MAKWIWLKVTTDKFELPLAVADSVAELAEIVGCTPNAIKSQLSKFNHGDLKTCHYRKVPSGEDEEDE